MAWTEERIELLKSLWAEGRSASQIAEILGHGLTRNAVIGKAHRLGLAARPSPVRTGEAGQAARPAQAGGAGDAAPAEAAPAEGERAAGGAATGEAGQSEPAKPQAVRPRARGPQKPPRITLLDLNDRICKWPIGHPDEPDFHFCGRPVQPPFPYCAEHCALAYQAQQPRRDRPAGPPPPFRPNLPRPR